MNVIRILTEKIEARALETKSPCKSYPTMEAAEAVGEKIAAEGARYLTHPSIENPVPAQYVVFQVPGLGNRWTVAFGLTEMLRRPDVGGYVGWFSKKNFYTF